MYSERLLDHFRSPRHAGELSPPAVVVLAENPACGDTLKLSARVERGRVVEAAFLARGCTASIACGSALAEWLTGRALADVTAGGAAAAVDMEVGGLPHSSKHAAVLAGDAVRLLLLEVVG